MKNYLLKNPYFLFAVFIFSCSNNSTSSKNSIDSKEGMGLSNMRLPTKSQLEVKTQTIGVSDVSVSYYRPNVNHRTIWGDLVKFDTVWKTGAENATVFKFKDDVLVDGKNLQKGSYSFFTIPRRNNVWTIIFNKNYNIFGTSEYNEKDDAIRFDVRAFDNEMTETMTIDFSSVQNNTAKVELKWEKKAIEFPIEFDNEKVVWQNINSYVKEIENSPDSIRWTSYLSFANYCVYAKDVNKARYAMSLIDKSLTIRETFENLKIKSDLFALENKIDSAMFYAKKAHKKGSSSRMPLEVANLLELNISKYDSLLKKK